jgi:hypothetical protein
MRVMDKGTPNSSHAVKVTRTPPRRSMRPAVIRLGGVPMIVARPPIDAP